MFISCDIRLETEEERSERIQVSLEVIEDLCRRCKCTPLDVAESLGLELAGAQVVN